MEHYKTLWVRYRALWNVTEALRIITGRYRMWWNVAECCRTLWNITEADCYGGVTELLWKIIEPLWKILILPITN